MDWIDKWIKFSGRIANFIHSWFSHNVYQEHHFAICTSALNCFHFQMQTEEVVLFPKLFSASAHQIENYSYLWVTRQDEQWKVH